MRECYVNLTIADDDLFDEGLDNLPLGNKCCGHHRSNMERFRIPRGRKSSDFHRRNEPRDDDRIRPVESASASDIPDTYRKVCRSFMASTSKSIVRKGNPRGLVAQEAFELGIDEQTKV